MPPIFVLRRIVEREIGRALSFPPWCGDAPARVLRRLRQWRLRSSRKGEALPRACACPRSLPRPLVASSSSPGQAALNLHPKAAAFGKPSRMPLRCKRCRHCLPPPPCPRRRSSALPPVRVGAPNFSFHESPLLARPRPRSRGLLAKTAFPQRPLRARHLLCIAQRAIGSYCAYWRKVFYRTSKGRPSAQILCAHRPHYRAFRASILHLNAPNGKGAPPSRQGACIFRSLAPPARGAKVRAAGGLATQLGGIFPLTTPLTRFYKALCRKHLQISKQFAAVCGFDIGIFGCFSIS